MAQTRMIAILALGVFLAAGALAYDLLSRPDCQIPVGALGCEKH